MRRRIRPSSAATSARSRAAWDSAQALSSAASTLLQPLEQPFRLRAIADLEQCVDRVREHRVDARLP